MIAVAALLTVAAACLTAAAAQRFRDAGQQINAALADPPSYDPDAEACALTRPDDPLEQTWALPAYRRPTRTTTGAFRCRVRRCWRTSTSGPPGRAPGPGSPSSAAGWVPTTGKR